MPDIVILLIIWGAMVSALGFGLVGFTLHIKDEVRKGHRAVWVYGPLVLAAMIGSGVWIVRSWIFNWGN
jgi:hypothetical protein